jgi:plasmid stabilization system protein ParE
MTLPLVEFDHRAINEARAARNWYARRSVAVAERFMAELDRAIEKISEKPDSWPKYLLGTRCFRLRRFPFLLVYWQTGSSVLILAVAHGKRRPGYWRKRLP